MDDVGMAAKDHDVTKTVEQSITDIAAQAENKGAAPKGSCGIGKG